MWTPACSRCSKYRPAPQRRRSLRATAKSIAGGDAAAVSAGTSKTELVRTALETEELKDDVLRRIALLIAWTMHLQDATTKGEIALAERIAKTVAAFQTKEVIDNSNDCAT